MNEKIVFGQYYNANSYLHKMDPRTKIISIIILMVALFLIENIYLLLSFFALVLVLISTSKVPFGKFINSIKTMSIIIIIVFITQIIFKKGDNMLLSLDFNLNILNLSLVIILIIFYLFSGKIIRKFRFLLFITIVFLCFYVQYAINISYRLTNYTIYIYQEGLEFSSFIVIRIISILLICSLLTLTTKPTDLNSGLDLLLNPLRKLKINTPIFTMMISIALRFIPTLLNEANKILKAQASRGVDFKEGHVKEKITQIISLIVPMLVIANKRADDLADAMEARAYDPIGYRTSLTDLKLKHVDVITLIISVLVLGSCIYLKVML